MKRKRKRRRVKRKDEEDKSFHCPDVIWNFKSLQDIIIYFSKMTVR